MTYQSLLTKVWIEDAVEVSTPIRPDNRPVHMFGGLTCLGCFTCKDRKKMCDSIYVYDDVHKMDKCTTCMKHNIFCHPERPLQWIEDPMQKQAEQLQRKELVKLGKRKSRESFDSLDQSIKARSPTLESKGGFSSHPTVFPSIELPWQNHNTSDAIATSVQRGSYTAIRGGRRLSKQGNKPRN